jgi:Domain of unknown function (DUF4864)
MEDADMAYRLQQMILAISIAAALVCGPALSQDAKSSPDARALIERQLDAFAHDDAPAAYAFAAPGIKAMFTDPGVFMSMVRQQYTPVYHHRSVEFGAAQVGADQIEQAVTFVDDNGQVWKALYKLARQPDGQWLITGCALIKSDDKSA